MKKLVVSLVLGASLAIVPSAFALKAMTADSMKDTTGQAGVSIAGDDIMIWKSGGTTTYTDIDDSAAFGGDSVFGGDIVITDSGGLMTIRAICDDTNRGGYLAHNYSTLMEGRNNIGVLPDGTADPHTAAPIAPGTANYIAHALTIDVTNELKTFSWAKNYNHTGSGATGAIRVAGIQIGLLTCEIWKGANTKSYSAKSTDASNPSANDNRSFIQVTKSDSITAILGGVIEIAPH